MTLQEHNQVCNQVVVVPVAVAPVMTPNHMQPPVAVPAGYAAQPSG